MKIVCPNCRKLLEFGTLQCFQCGEILRPRVRYPHFDENRDEMSEQDKRLENFYANGL